VTIAGPEIARAAAELDLSTAQVYAIPMTARFRGITVREGVLIQGPAGWGEFCPFAEYDDHVAASWLATAVESAVLGWPAPVRERISINATVPTVGPERAHQIVAASGCRTAKVKVADHPDSLAEDCARLEAVRDALGPDGFVRVDANGLWDVDTAVVWIPELDRASGGLQYVEQPCRTIEELAAVRRRVQVPIAADESIRRAEDPLKVAVAGAADIAVVKCTPLGGVRRSWRSPLLRACPPCPPHWRPSGAVLLALAGLLNWTTPAGSALSCSNVVANRCCSATAAPACAENFAAPTRAAGRLRTDPERISGGPSAFIAHTACSPGRSADWRGPQLNRASAIRPAVQPVRPWRPSAGRGVRTADAPCGQRATWTPHKVAVSG
jgi:hypothetical protein